MSMMKKATRQAFGDEILALGKRIKTYMLLI